MVYTPIYQQLKILIDSMSPSGRAQKLEKKISSFFKPKKPSLFGHVSSKPSLLHYL